MSIEMISLRTFRLATTKGHIILFKAKEPRPVPNDAVTDAMAAGCVPTHPDDAPLFEDLAKAKVEFQGDLRRSIIFLAMEVIAKENNSKQFTAGGRPKTAVMVDRLGFELTDSEIGAAWQDYMTVKGSGDDVQLHPNAIEVMKVLGADSLEGLRAIARQQNINSKELEGVSVRDLRRVLLVKLSGVAFAQAA
jgi:hypothetical protein